MLEFAKDLTLSPAGPSQARCHNSAIEISEPRFGPQSPSVTVHSSAVFGPLIAAGAAGRGEAVPKQAHP